MEIKRAEMMARDLMNLHGLFDGNTPWHFAWDNAKMRFGVTKAREHIVGLSLPHTVNRSEEDVLDTILHEIAHVLVGVQQRHNGVWQAKAVELGAHGRTCGNGEPLPGKYSLACIHCSEEIKQFHRKPSDKYTRAYHSVCGREKGRLKVVPL